MPFFYDVRKRRLFNEEIKIYAILRSKGKLCRFYSILLRYFTTVTIASVMIESYMSHKLSGRDEVQRYNL